MKILITQRVIDYKNGPYDCLDHGFYKMFKGHILIPIPNINYQYDWKNNKPDLVVFSGGNSMIKDNWQYSEQRLDTEDQLYKDCVDNDIKMLGISRGALFLAKKLGCGLMPTKLLGLDHKVDHYILQDKEEPIKVHSRHEEVLNIDKAEKGFKSIAKDEDNFTESYIYKNICGVLWHPERMKDCYLPKKIKRKIGVKNVE